jgi:menaquinone-dependent protoporphyrinogen IX oxidase
MAEKRAGGTPLSVLVSAASTHGATAEIAEEIGATLSRHGFAVTMMTPEQVRYAGDYDAVIIGSAVYAGHWLDPAKDLVYRSRDLNGDFRDWGGVRQWADDIARELERP